VRAVVQRVRRASVTVDGACVGRIETGLVVLAAVMAGDGPADVDYIASKVRELRIFPDAAGRMNRSVGEASGSILVVSQFTLAGDVRKGRRPAFDAAAPAPEARALFDALVARLREGGRVETGLFQAHMDVELVNDGPVTILLDSSKTF
jgi:D-tyrosyl-tRNA(Tyr) deacylase